MLPIEHLINPAVTDALEGYARYCSESAKFESGILETIRVSREKFAETRALIVKADRLLNDSRKVYAKL